MGSILLSIQPTQIAACYMRSKLATKDEIVMLKHRVPLETSVHSPSEHAGYVVRRVLAMESLSQQPEYPEYRPLGDVVVGDPSLRVSRGRTICLATACSLRAFRGSAIPSSHAFTTLAREGRLLVLAKRVTFKGKPGYVKKRPCELLKLT